MGRKGEGDRNPVPSGLDARASYTTADGRVVPRGETSAVGPLMPVADADRWGPGRPIVFATDDLETDYTSMSMFMEPQLAI